MKFPNISINEFMATVSLEGQKDKTELESAVALSVDPGEEIVTSITDNLSPVYSSHDMTEENNDIFIVISKTPEETTEERGN